MGCNLRCKFCWSWRVRDNAARVGEWYHPWEVAEKIVAIAKRRGYRYVRVSGGEPTISFDHLLEVIRRVEELDASLVFILETNGILIGADEKKAEALSSFRNVHVRVSLKGCTSRDFAMLTGAVESAFELQVRALEHLAKYGVSTNPAVMMSFSDPRDCEELRERLGSVSFAYYEGFEEEYVFLYRHVEELLRRHGLRPRVAYRPEGIPEELV